MSLVVVMMLLLDEVLLIQVVQLDETVNILPLNEVLVLLLADEVIGMFIIQ